MVREIGRRTRSTNREVQEVVETLVDVWTEALVAGEKIEIQNFLVLEVRDVELSPNHIFAYSTTTSRRAVRRISLRVSKKIRNLINQKFS